MLRGIRTASSNQTRFVLCRLCEDVWVSNSWLYAKSKRSKTLNSGYLGSRNDEERSEMRYVMRIAEFSESSKL